MSGRSDPVLSRQGWSNVEDFIEHQFIFCVGCTPQRKTQQQIEALTKTVQKVSDQVVLSKPAPQLVANP
jgi:hypothetical protein